MVEPQLYLRGGNRYGVWWWCRRWWSSLSSWHGGRVAGTADVNAELRLKLGKRYHGVWKLVEHRRRWAGW